MAIGLIMFFFFFFALFFFFFQAEDGIRDIGVTGVQTCALPIYFRKSRHDFFVITFDALKCFRIPYSV